MRKILSYQEFYARQRKYQDYYPGMKYKEFQRKIYEERGYKESTIRRLTEPKKKSKRKTVKRKVSREKSGITVTDYKDFLPVKVREGLRTGKYTEHQLKLLYKEIYYKQQERNLALKKAGYDIVKLAKPSELKDTRSIIFEVAGAVRKSESVYATVKGAKEKDIRTMATLNKNYSGLNLKSKEDLRTFGQFMQEVRAFMGNVIFDSDRAVEMYDRYLDGESIADLFSEYKERLSKR